MTRKQVSFRRDVNVVEESPSALSVASEGTAGFLSISQTRMLLSMVDDNSVFTTSTGSGSGDETWSESELAVPVTTSTSPSPSTGRDGDIDDYQNDNNNENESHETELDSHMDSGSDNDNEGSTHRPPVPAEKVTPQESETSCETALDDSEHDDNQESLQVHGGPLQPTTVRQSPNKSIGSPRSRSRSTSNSQSTSLTSRNGDKEVSPDSSLHKNDHFQQVGAVQVPAEASAPNTPENKKQTPINPHFSSQSTSVPETDVTSRQVNQQDNPPVRASRRQPDSSRSAYETDPFASPVSTGSSDFHIRKLDSDMDSQLAETMMDIAPSHGNNDEGSTDWHSEKDHNFPPPEEIKPKADGAEMSVMENSDEDSAISISSDEGLLDRAVRRKSNRQNFPDRQSYSSSRLSIRRNSAASKEKHNQWRVKVPTRRESIGSKSKTRKSVSEKSMPMHESVLSTELPKTEQLEIDDDSSVESPLPDATLLNEPSDNFFDDSINEHRVEIKQHEALDSDSDDDSPILLIKPRRTEQHPEKNVVEVKESNLAPENNAKVMLPTRTKQYEAIDSDSDDDSPILLIKPRRTEQQPEKKVVGVKESSLTPENNAKVMSPTTTRQHEALDSDCDEDSPILLIKPRRTDQQPEKNVAEVKKSNLTPENNAKVTSPTQMRQHEVLDSDSDIQSPIQLVEPRRTERQPVVEQIKLIPQNKTKGTTPTTTNSVFASKKMDTTSTEVKSPKASTIAKAHDPPGFHGVIGPNDAATKPKISTSSEITKEPPADSIKPQTPVKQTVKQEKTEKPTKKQSKTSGKKPKHKDGKELKSTKATSAVSQETYEETIMPLNDKTKKGPGKTVQTRKKAKETKPKDVVKSKKAKSLKVDPEPDKLPPYELSYKPSQQADSPYQRQNSSMRSIDSDGIWRPPKNIPGLNDSANDMNSPDRSTSTLGSDDLNLTQVEWRSIKASIVRTERNNGDTSQGSSLPRTPDITADRGKIGARNPATATQFSPVELNAITLSGNRSDASSSDYQGTPGASSKIGRFMKWPRGNRNEPTRRFSNESFEGANVPSISTRDKVHNEDVELEKTPKAPKSKTFMWPTIPRLPSIDKNLSEVAADNHQETKTVEDTKKVQSPRIIAKSLPESYPSMQSPDRQIKEPAYSPLDVTTTPKKTEK